MPPTSQRVSPPTCRQPARPMTPGRIPEGWTGRRPPTPRPPSRGGAWGPARPRATLGSLVAALLLVLAITAPVEAGPPRGMAAHNYLRVRPNVSSSPTGLSPATVKSAYGFPTSSTAGAGTTIAIVDAYDHPKIESDLAVFSTQFGLPACTTANGCFRKVDQNGGTSYPKRNAGWALEIALDVEWAHAIAPGARILLVEATSNSFTNLLAAEDYARTHAHYVSNSWGAAEFSGESSYDSHFSGSGVSFFVSSGDNGTPAEYPSSSPNVISVGGTTLHFNGGSFSSETGWSGSGGGCSVYENRNTAQSTGSVTCNGKRATPDVSLVADPASGVSVYDSFRYQGQAGWWTVGGTS